MSWADLLGRYRIICIITGVRGFFPCLLFQSRGARFMHRQFNSVCFGGIWSACRRTAGNHFHGSGLFSIGLPSSGFSNRGFPGIGLPGSGLSRNASG